jgi:transcriptional regulator with XRE-family HTH domain
LENMKPIRQGLSRPARLTRVPARGIKPDEPPAGLDLGARIRAIRQSKELTLADVAKRCGVSASGLSKIENGTISPTYGNLLRIARGLAVSISEIVADAPAKAVTARRSVCRRGQGIVYSIGTHSWELVCTDLANKKMQPMIGRILARRMDEVSGLTSHPGEEVMYVVSGEVILHTEHYEPVRLKAGDCAYFDSTMGHRCLRASNKEAVVFWVCSDVRSADSLSEVALAADSVALV